MGNWAFKILVRPLLYFISYLPFPLLYRLSSFLYFVVYYLAGYRKQVVRANIQNAFPAMTGKEREATVRAFYLHFCDVIFETIKLLTISRKEFLRRCILTTSGRATFEKYFAANQTIVGVMGHCGNWEWGAISHQLFFTRMITGVYHPLTNKQFDALMLKLRRRFGGDIVPMNALYRRLIELQKKNISTTIGLIADQTPPPESAYWLTFLNQDTPVFNGPEKLARKFNYPVVFLSIIKKGRGYYELDATTVTDTPRELPDGMISEMHTRLLEKNIYEVPHAWLWSHRRWKHRRPRTA